MYTIESPQPIGLYPNVVEQFIQLLTIGMRVGCVRGIHCGHCKKIKFSKCNRKSSIIINGFNVYLKHNQLSFHSFIDVVLTYLHVETPENYMPPLKILHGFQSGLSAILITIGKKRRVLHSKEYAKNTERIDSIREYE